MAAVWQTLREVVDAEVLGPEILGDDKYPHRIATYDTASSSSRVVSCFLEERAIVDSTIRLRRANYWSEPMPARLPFGKWRLQASRLSDEILATGVSVPEMQPGQQHAPKEESKDSRIGLPHPDRQRVIHQDQEKDDEGQAQKVR